MNTKLLIATIAAITSAAGVGYWLVRRSRAQAKDKPGEQPEGERLPSASEPAPSPTPSPPAPAATKPVSDADAPTTVPWWLSGLQPAREPASKPATTPAPPTMPPQPIRGTVQTPLPEPTHPDSNQRINWSKREDTVSLSPEALLAQARRYDPTITMDELAGARLAASEHGRGSFTELAAIIDSELNRAERARMSLFESLTRGHGFGRQDRRRPASTRQADSCHI